MKRTRRDKGMMEMLQGSGRKVLCAGIAVGLLWTLPLLAWNKKKEAAAKDTGPAVGDLAMPSGWSDNMFDQLTKGQDPRRTIAVLEFKGSEKIPVELGLSLSDMAITYLHNTGKFNVVERTRLEQVLKEQEFQLKDLVETQVAQIGKLLGADAVVFGTVTGTKYGEVSTRFPSISFKPKSGGYSLRGREHGQDHLFRAIGRQGGKETD